MTMRALATYEDAHHDQFMEQGYLRLGKVLSADELDALQQRIDDRGQADRGNARHAGCVGIDLRGGQGVGLCGGIVKEGGSVGLRQVLRPT